MSTVSLELFGLPTLQEMEFEITIESQLITGEPHIPITATVTWFDSDSDRPDIGQVVGRVAISLLDRLDFDVCDELSQQAYEVWADCFEEHVLCDDRIDGRVLMVTEASFQPGLQAPIGESLLAAILEHCGGHARAALIDRRWALDGDVDLEAAGFEPLTEHVLVCDLWM